MSSRDMERAPEEEGRETVGLGLRGVAGISGSFFAPAPATAASDREEEDKLPFVEVLLTFGL
jgi:hypothetical protein